MQSIGITPPLVDGQVLILGCSIKGIAVTQRDEKNKKTFLSKSDNSARGAKTGEQAEGGFKVEPAKGTINTLQASDFRLTDTTPAVAKLLVALAGLIAPEITV